ncbi:hypothetical protein PsorP6_005111 [Peronosclerospora sorghi]|uniref:Uncharacterized protein n=1 Tax=Peronosclerospora sorghi TaxID=230839 RepID=A0ACC0W4T1_9STRA|nr:hypothetical protein PsorP6_005111 [Peronosclerospora sorghi]
MADEAADKAAYELADEAAGESSGKSGYAIDAKASCKQRKGRFRVYCKCDCGSHYRNRLGITAEKRKQKNASSLIDFPFLFVAQQAISS